MNTRHISCRLIPVTVFVMLFMQGCAAFHPYQSRNLSERITESQESWRASGLFFKADALPKAGLGPQGQIQNMLDRLVYVSPLRGHDIRLLIVNDSKINASTDGKAVYLSSGLLQAAWPDEGLIAGVIAHELGHLVANHTPKKSGIPESGLQILSPLLGTTKFGALGALALKEGLFMHRRAYSRRDEMEADAIAIMLAFEAGFDPHGLERFLKAAAEKKQFPGTSLQIPVTNYADPSLAAQGAALFLLRASPLYRSHPSGRKRTEAVELMIRVKKGDVTLEEFESQSGQLAQIYRVLEARRPKSRPAKTA